MMSWEKVTLYYLVFLIIITGYHVVFGMSHKGSFLKSQNIMPVLRKDSYVTSQCAAVLNRYTLLSTITQHQFTNPWPCLTNAILVNPSLVDHVLFDCQSLATGQLSDPATVKTMRNLGSNQLVQCAGTELDCRVYTSDRASALYNGDNQPMDVVIPKLITCAKRVDHTMRSRLISEWFGFLFSTAYNLYNGTGLEGDTPSKSIFTLDYDWAHAYIVDRPANDTTMPSLVASGYTTKNFETTDQCVRPAAFHAIGCVEVNGQWQMIYDFPVPGSTQYANATCILIGKNNPRSLRMIFDPTETRDTYLCITGAGMFISNQLHIDSTTLNCWFTYSSDNQLAMGIGIDDAPPFSTYYTCVRRNFYFSLVDQVNLINANYTVQLQARDRRISPDGLSVARNSNPVRVVVNDTVKWEETRSGPMILRMPDAYQYPNATASQAEANGNYMLDRRAWIRDYLGNAVYLTYSDTNAFLGTLLVILIPAWIFLGLFILTIPFGLIQFILDYTHYRKHGRCSGCGEFHYRQIGWERKVKRQERILQCCGRFSWVDKAFLPTSPNHDRIYVKRQWSYGNGAYLGEQMFLIKMCDPNNKKNNHQCSGRFQVEGKCYCIAWHKPVDLKHNHFKSTYRWEKVQRYCFPIYILSYGLLHPIRTLKSFPYIPTLLAAIVVLIAYMPLYVSGDCPVENFQPPWTNYASEHDIRATRNPVFTKIDTSCLEGTVAVRSLYLGGSTGVVASWNEFPDCPAYKSDANAHCPPGGTGYGCSISSDHTYTDTLCASDSPENQCRVWSSPFINQASKNSLFQIGLYFPVSNGEYCVVPYTRSTSKVVNLNTVGWIWYSGYIRLDAIFDIVDPTIAFELQLINDFVEDPQDPDDPLSVDWLLDPNATMTAVPYTAMYYVPYIPHQQIGKLYAVKSFDEIPVTGMGYLYQGYIVKNGAVYSGPELRWMVIESDEKFYFPFNIIADNVEPKNISVNNTVVMNITEGVSIVAQNPPPKRVAPPPLWEKSYHAVHPAKLDVKGRKSGDDVSFTINFETCHEDVCTYKSTDQFPINIVKGTSKLIKYTGDVTQNYKLIVEDSTTSVLTTYIGSSLTLTYAWDGFNAQGCGGGGCAEHTYGCGLSGLMYAWIRSDEGVFCGRSGLPKEYYRVWKWPHVGCYFHEYRNCDAQYVYLYEVDQAKLRVDWYEISKVWQNVTFALEDISSGEVVRSTVSTYDQLVLSVGDVSVRLNTMTLIEQSDIRQGSKIGLAYDTFSSPAPFKIFFHDYGFSDTDSFKAFTTRGVPEKTFQNLNDMSYNLGTCQASCSSASKNLVNLQFDKNNVEEKFLNTPDSQGFSLQDLHVTDQLYVMSGEKDEENAYECYKADGGDSTLTGADCGPGPWAEVEDNIHYPIIDNFVFVNTKATKSSVVETIIEGTVQISAEEIPATIDSASCEITGLTLQGSGAFVISTIKASVFGYVNIKSNIAAVQIIQERFYVTSVTGTYTVPAYVSMTMETADIMLNNGTYTCKCNVSDQDSNNSGGNTGSGEGFGTGEDLFSGFFDAIGGFFSGIFGFIGDILSGFFGGGGTTIWTIIVIVIICVIGWMLFKWWRAPTQALKITGLIPPTLSEKKER